MRTDSDARTRSRIPWRAMVAQLAIIVAGVLIALLAQGVWNNRQDRAREEAYLDQLRTDLAVTRERLIAQLAKQDSLIQRSSTMLQAMRSTGALPPSDSIERWYLVSTALNWRPVTGTLRALMATGDIRLISDPRKRSAIIDFVATLESSEEELNRQGIEALTRASATRDRLEPYIIPPKYQWADTTRTARLQTPLRFDVARMKNDPGIASVYANIRITNQNYWRRYADVLNATDSLIAIIGQRY